MLTLVLHRHDHQTVHTFGAHSGVTVAGPAESGVGRVIGGPHRTVAGPILTHQSDIVTDREVQASIDRGGRSIDITDMVSYLGSGVIAHRDEREVGVEHDPRPLHQSGRGLVDIVASEQLDGHADQVGQPGLTLILCLDEPVDAFGVSTGTV